MKAFDRVLTTLVFFFCSAFVLTPTIRRCRITNGSTSRK